MAGYMSEMAASQKNPGGGRRIDILPIPGFAMISFAALTEPMPAANLLARRRLYDTVPPSAVGRPMPGSGSSSVMLLSRLDQAGAFGYLFVDKLGRSAMRYFRALRLDKAQNPLRNAALPLTEIALATGFASSAHFSRTCSDRFGYPPSAER